MTSAQKVEALTPLEMSPDAKESIAALRTLTQIDVPRVPEPVFRQQLLPVLTDTSGQTDLRVWQDFAGTVNRPIDVIDGGGNVLFRVPALVRTVPTLPNGATPRESFGNIIATAKLKTDVHPKVGETFLSDALATKLRAHSPDLESIRMWNKVLAYYKLELIPLEGTNPADTDAAGPVTDLSNVFTGEDDVL